MRPGDLAGLDHLNAHEQRVRRPAHRHTGIVEQQTAPRRDALFEHVAGFNELVTDYFPRPKISLAARLGTADALGQQRLVLPLAGDK